MNDIIQSNKIPDYVNECSECDFLRCREICSRSLELSDEYILIFNSYFRLVEYSKSSIKILKNEALKDHLLGNDISFFIPEFKGQWSLEYYLNNSVSGGILLSEDYMAKSPCNRDSVYVKQRISRLENHIITIATDISEQKQAKDLSLQQEKKLNELDQECYQLKITLDVLLRRLEEKQDEIERNYYHNLEEMVFPMLDLLKATKLEDQQAATIDILEANLKTIIEPFARLLNNENRKFTQREIQIANLIRLGKTTKEISTVLHLSCKTVDFHRANIRKRLAISNTKDNLRSFLMAMSKQSRN